MAPPGGARAPGPTNVVILSKIPEGITETHIKTGAGRFNDVLQVSFRPADLDGPGWAIVAFASPDVAKVARERLDGKVLPGQAVSAVVLEASLGEGLYGNMRTSDLDSPWKEARTPQGQVYYYHAVTRQVAWTKPLQDFNAAPGVGGMPGEPRVVAAVRPAASAVQGQAALSAAQSAISAATRGTAGAEGGERANLSSGPVGANLFIYHIPVTWDDSILRQHFEHFGKIISCRVQKDADGRPRGFGFVSFAEPAAAQAAIAGMHGFPVEGKHLKVQLKKGDEQAMNPSTAAAAAAAAQGPGGPGGLLDLGLGGLGGPAQPPPPPGAPPGGFGGYGAQRTNFPPQPPRPY